MLTLSGVKTGYGRLQILRGVDMEVPDGGVVALLGGNGTGKSTLLKAVSGLLPVWEGSITFDGQDISALKPHQIVRAGLVQVTQGKESYPAMTVEENLQVGAFTRTDKAIVDPEGLIASFCDSAGAWLPLLCVMNLTGVTEAVRGVFGGRSHEELTAAAEQVPAGCDGLTFLPYLAGERVPDLPDATGTLLGLRPGLLTAGHLYRAALEGTSHNLAWGVDRMRRLGIAVDSVRLVGGAARNRLWQQILADALNAPVSVTAEQESAALGGALQAIWTVARASDPEASIDAVAQPFIEVEGAPVTPDPETAATYAERGQAFRAAVEKLHS